MHRVLLTAICGVIALSLIAVVPNAAATVQLKSDKKDEKEKKLSPGTYARFETTEGNFVIRLFENEVPKTVDNFVGLAEGTKEWTDPKTGEKVKRPFYDGLTFHRIIDGFMIQG